MVLEQFFFDTVATSEKADAAAVRCTCHFWALHEQYIV